MFRRQARATTSFRLIVFWITLGTIHIILLRWLPDASWHGGLQVASDVVMISALVYATGLQDSYFISLYLLVIIVASILFSRRVAYATAVVCITFLGGLTALAYLGRIPTHLHAACPARKALRFWFLSNLFGFFAVAYLASLLAQSLRRKGLELEEKREELLDLQDFTEDIIHSMRGGLITTDMDGRIVLLNRTGEDILGYRFADIRGRKLSEISEAFWLPGLPEPERQTIASAGNRFSDARMDQQRFLGISISPLRSRDNQAQRLRLQFSGPDRFSPAGAGSGNQGAHGSARPAVGGHRARNPPAADRHGWRGERAGPAGAP